MLINDRKAFYVLTYISEERLSAEVMEWRVHLSQRTLPLSLKKVRAVESSIANGPFKYFTLSWEDAPSATWASATRSTFVSSEPSLILVSAANARRWGGSGRDLRAVYEQNVSLGPSEWTTVWMAFTSARNFCRALESRDQWAQLLANERVESPDSFGARGGPVGAEYRWNCGRDRGSWGHSQKDSVPHVKQRSHRQHEL